MIDRNRNINRNRNRTEISVKEVDSETGSKSRPEPKQEQEPKIIQNFLLIVYKYTSKSEESDNYIMAVQLISTLLHLF